MLRSEPPPAFSCSSRICCSVRSPGMHGLQAGHIGLQAQLLFCGLACALGDAPPPLLEIRPRTGQSEAPLPRLQGACPAWGCRLDAQSCRLGAHGVQAGYAGLQSGCVGLQPQRGGAASPAESLPGPGPLARRQRAAPQSQRPCALKGRGGEGWRGAHANKGVHDSRSLGWAVLRWGGPWGGCRASRGAKAGHIPRR